VSISGLLLHGGGSVGERDPQLQVGGWVGGGQIERGQNKQDYFQEKLQNILKTGNIANDFENPENK
jgi:hypothetical protein